VRDVVAEHLRRLVPVRRASGGMEEGDVVRPRAPAPMLRRARRDGQRARRCATRARAAARCRGLLRARGLRPPRQRGSAARVKAALLRLLRDPPPPRREPTPDCTGKRSREHRLWQAERYAALRSVAG
jgi:hypothetical protein